MGFERRSVVTSLFCIFFLSTSLAQIKVGDNATSINSRSILEMESTDKAVYFPRLTSAQVAAQSGWQAGMLVYNSDSNCLYQYNGTNWNCLAVTSSYVEPWFGDDDDAGATTNTEDIYHLGRVGIGINDPGTYKLNIQGGHLHWSYSTTNTDHTVELSTPGGETGLIFNFGNTGNRSRFDVSNVANGTAGNRYFGLSYNNETGLYIRKGGNVGIGTTAPSQKLDVNGAARIRTLGSTADTNFVVIADNDGKLEKVSAGSFAINRRVTHENAGAKTYLITTDASNYVGFSIFGEIENTACNPSNIERFRIDCFRGLLYYTELGAGGVSVSSGNGTSSLSLSHGTGCGHSNTINIQTFSNGTKVKVSNSTTSGYLRYRMSWAF